MSTLREIMDPASFWTAFADGLVTGIGIGAIVLIFALRGTSSGEAKPLAGAIGRADAGWLPWSSAGGFVPSAALSSHGAELRDEEMTRIRTPSLADPAKPECELVHTEQNFSATKSPAGHGEALQINEVR